MRQFLECVLLLLLLFLHLLLKDIRVDVLLDRLKLIRVDLTVACFLDEPTELAEVKRSRVRLVQEVEDFIGVSFGQQNLHLLQSDTKILLLDFTFCLVVEEPESIDQIFVLFMDLAPHILK